MLTAKYDKMLEINKEQNKKLEKFGIFYDAVKKGISLTELQKYINRMVLSFKLDNKE